MTRFLITYILHISNKSKQHILTAEVKLSKKHNCILYSKSNAQVINSGKMKVDALKGGYLYSETRN